MNGFASEFRRQEVAHPGDQRLESGTSGPRVIADHPSFPLSRFRQALTCQMEIAVDTY